MKVGFGERETISDTIIGEWFPEEKDKELVDTEMRLYCCCVRTAFKRLLEGMPKPEIEKLCQERFSLNSRYVKDGIMEAEGITQSQRELLPQSLCDKKRQLEKSQKKLSQVKDLKKRQGLGARIHRLKNEIASLEQHLEGCTIPKVIFGGRENFEKVSSGEMTSEEWKDLRSKTLYSRGDKSKGGNLNTRIVLTEEGFDLEVAISHLTQKGMHAPRVKGKLWVDSRREDQLLDLLLLGRIYSIRLVRGFLGKYRVHITFEQEVMERRCDFSSGAIGVDLNPQGIAQTEIDREGNFVRSEWIHLPELFDARGNRRDNLIGETAKEIVFSSLAKGKGLVIENLSFRQDQHTDKKFNRVRHNFAYRKLLIAIEREACEQGVALRRVNPAYTSVIGKYKYAEQLGLSAHQAAALVIARRGLGFRERVPRKVQQLIPQIVLNVTKLCPAMEAKARCEVKRLLRKLDSWKEIHSWSFWYTFKTLLRKVGVYSWFLRDIRLALGMY